jgi:hypothetical protein
MKRSATILAGALAAAAAVTAANGSPSRHTTLDLAVDGRHAIRTLVDAPPRHSRGVADDSPGDAVVLHAPLLGPNGKGVGLIDGTFVTTATGTSAKQDGTELLTATLTLTGGGQLAIQGIVGAFASTTHVAIVGGTGRYAGARGEVTAHFTPRAVELHLDLS